MERSTSSRTETGVQVADPFRQAVTNAEKAIDKLQTAYTVLSSLSQLASVAQELLPGVGAAVGIVANMVNSAKTVAVNRVAALRLVSFRPSWSLLTSGRALRYHLARGSASYYRHQGASDSSHESQH